MNIVCRLIGAASLLVLASVPAFADNFGAIAFSQSSGAHGWSYDFGSRWAAEDAALRQCGGDCSVVVWFRNACGALAVGGGNAYGTGWSASRHEAEAIALSNCYQHSGSCSIRRWACTTR
jgi:hypothetical protein